MTDTPNAGTEPLPVATAVVDEPKPRKVWLWRAGWSAAGAGVVALIAFAGYLLYVNSQWTAQNEALRAEALEMGTTLANERAAATELAAELETVASQRDTATERITELANEEANAIDDRAVLEDMVTAYIHCVDLLEDHIYVVRTGRVYDGGLSYRQVENEYTDGCDAITASWKTYLAEKDS